MKLLILTFYYQPDLCAGSFRSSALVKSLQQKLGCDDSIEIIASMPNRYKSLRNDALLFEQKGNVTIHRIPMPSHNSGIIDQSIAFVRYWRAALQLIDNQDYDLIYASSARLFTGFLGAIIANKKSKPLYLDVRDILSDTLQDVIKFKFLNLFLIPIIRKIEKYTVQSASHLNLVSEGYRDSFPYFKGKITFFTNGIDDTFLTHNFNAEVKYPKIITYAGNIGEGQGLEKIIPEVAKRLSGKYIFNIIGDGGTKRKLIRKLSDLQIDNVYLIPPMNRNNLLKYYQQSDFLFLHLNDYEAFKKVLPSKIFEYGATEKPIIAGVDGYAREFVENHLEESLIFEPCNINQLVRVLDEFQPKPISRKKFIQKFSRDSISEQMAESLLLLSDFNAKISRQVGILWV